MPVVVGGTLDFAVDQLNRLNIKYNVEEDPELSEQEENPEYPENFVVGTDTEPGTRLRRFSGEVTLYLAP